MRKKPSESVRKYGQRVKALIQKLTTEIAQSVQVEWYVAGFLEKMGFQIQQTRPDTLWEAMEAAHNYENSAQSLRKSLKKFEEKGKNHRRRRLKYSSSSESDSISKSETTASASSSSDDDTAVSSKGRNRHPGNGKDQRGKELIKVKVKEDDSRRLLKNIQDTLAAIQVNLAESRKPRRTTPTSRANVWCARCGEAGHFLPECNRPLQKRIQYVLGEVTYLLNYVVIRVNSGRPFPMLLGRPWLYMAGVLVDWGAHEFVPGKTRQRIPWRLDSYQGETSESDGYMTDWSDPKEGEEALSYFVEPFVESTEADFEFPLPIKE